MAGDRHEQATGPRRRRGPRSTKTGSPSISSRTRTSSSATRACSHGCELPHQRGSAAISLVERQVLVLREKHGDARAQAPGADRERPRERRDRGPHAPADAPPAARARLRGRRRCARDLAARGFRRLALGAAASPTPSLPGIAELAATQHVRVVPRGSAGAAGSSRRSSRTHGRAAARSATRSASTCSAATAGTVGSTRR